MMPDFGDDISISLDGPASSSTTVEPSNLVALLNFFFLFFFFLAFFFCSGCLAESDSPLVSSRALLAASADSE